MIEDRFIEIGGERYAIADLPADVQKLVKIYEQWEHDIGRLKMEMLKTETAKAVVYDQMVSRMTRPGT